MSTPAEDPQVHGQGPGRVPLSDSSGTEGEKSDSYQVFPDYSQLVPDRTPRRQEAGRIPETRAGYVSLLRFVKYCFVTL